MEAHRVFGSHENQRHAGFDPNPLSSTAQRMQTKSSERRANQSWQIWSSSPVVRVPPRTPQPRERCAKGFFGVRNARRC